MYYSDELKGSRSILLTVNLSVR